MFEYPLKLDRLTGTVREASIENFVVNRINFGRHDGSRSCQVLSLDLSTHHTDDDDTTTTATLRIQTNVSSADVLHRFRNAKYNGQVIQVDVDGTPASKNNDPSPAIACIKIVMSDLTPDTFKSTTIRQFVRRGIGRACRILTVETADDDGLAVVVVEHSVGSRPSAIRQKLQRLQRNSSMQISVTKLSEREWTEILNKNHIPRLSEGPPDKATHQTTRYGSNRRERKEKLMEYAKELDTCFHLHVHSTLEGGPFIERVELGNVFQNFLAGFSSEERPTRDLKTIEANVMALLRQQRLIRTDRYHDGRLLVTVAGLGGPGDFPPTNLIRMEREKALEALQIAQSNKNGVVVSEPYLGDLVVKQNSQTEIHFSIKSEDPTTEFCMIKMTGRRTKAFVLPQNATEEQTISPEVEFTIIFTPKMTGLYRAFIRFFFRKKDGSEFFIDRVVKVRSGDSDLFDLVKPKSAYKKKKKKPSHLENREDEVLFPPRDGNQSSNPYKGLPRFQIPKNVERMVIASEYEHTLEKPEEVTAETYAEFWEALLYANEVQARQDIRFFDMESATLARRGRFMVLNVPGLAEGRPSVLKGDLVSVVWKNKLCRGRVEKTELLDVLLTFNDSLHRSFDTSLDRVEVRFSFSRVPFRTCHNGVRMAPEQLGESMLFPSFGHVESCLLKSQGREIDSLNYANRNLNDEQKRAIVSAMRGVCRPLPYIIYGPPGTGKTTTTVETVYQLAKHKSKQNILLVAPSNDAVDVLVEKLSRQFPPSEMRRLLAYSRALDQLLPTVQRYANEGLQPSDVVAEAMSTQICVATVGMALRLSTFGVPRGHFHVLCVDEAGHATEPEVVAIASTLMNFGRTDAKAGQIILAGDPKQLGPIVSSELCTKFGLGVSYMERLSLRKIYSRQVDGEFPAPLITKLVRNYRSHPAIVDIPNEKFYDDELICSASQMRTHNMVKWEHLPNKGDFPIVFHAIHGENCREGSSPSWFNPQEIQEVINYVQLLTRESRPPVAGSDIGIITPYAMQVQKIRQAIAAKNLGEDIKVGSVETFQGQERRCIIASIVRSEVEMVASDAKANLGFVANEKRFNVAITRAAALLVVIGDPDVLATDENNWLSFLRYCKENNGWAGEEWTEEDSKENQPSSEDTEADDSVENVASQRVSQEAVPFMNREE